jgi:hypothetical protein
MYNHLPRLDPRANLTCFSPLPKQQEAIPWTTSHFQLGSFTSYQLCYNDLFQVLRVRLSEKTPRIITERTTRVNIRPSVGCATARKKNKRHLNGLGLTSTSPQLWLRLARWWVSQQAQMLSFSFILGHMLALMARCGYVWLTNTLASFGPVMGWKSFTIFYYYYDY